MRNIGKRKTSHIHIKWLAFSFKKGDLSETKDFWENKKEEKT